MLKHTIDLAQNVEALKPIVNPDRHPSAKSSTADAGESMGYARQLKILAPQGLGFETMDTPASAEVVFYEAGDPWPPGHLDTTVVVVSFENAAAIGARLVELTSGRLRAALDVTDPEPLPAGHPLWSAPGLLLTPHVAGSTEGAWERAWAVAMRQIAIFAGGDTPPNLVAGRGAG
ncbi:MAG: NAD(P)-dependent oxidoreductase [Mycobacterium sp.]|uniref:NAD(P)-dependent oxidoreductase n=1 Tax=Mycobacterium sp. TaxID=1785 RepID=UPI003899C05B